MQSSLEVQSQHLNFAVALLLLFFSLFLVLQLFRIYIFFQFVTFSVSQLFNFRVHVFIRCFYCLIQLLLPLVFQFSLPLCFRRRSRHSNLANFVIFCHFLLALFEFHLVSCSAYLIQLVDVRLFQLIALWVQNKALLGLVLKFR